MSACVQQHWKISSRMRCKKENTHYSKLISYGTKIHAYAHKILYQHITYIVYEINNNIVPNLNYGILGTHDPREQYVNCLVGGPQRLVAE